MTGGELRALILMIPMPKQAIRRGKFLNDVRAQAVHQRVRNLVRLAIGDPALGKAAGTMVNGQMYFHAQPEINKITPLKPRTAPASLLEDEKRDRTERRVLRFAPIGRS